MEWTRGVLTQGFLPECGSAMTARISGESMRVFCSDLVYVSDPAVVEYLLIRQVMISARVRELAGETTIIKWTLWPHSDGRRPTQAHATTIILDLWEIATQGKTDTTPFI